MKTRLVTMGLCLVGAGCSADRLVATFRPHVDAGIGTDDEHWGHFVAQLLPASWLPSCPDGGVLRVDTLEDELEGGPGLTDPAQAGATTSLREAIHLAANTPGQHTIGFDERVFPLASPGVIRINDDALTFPLAGLQHTCIDGVGRGVIIEWALPATGQLACDRQCIWSLGVGSSMTGLVIRGNPPRLSVTDAVIRANRFAVDETAVGQGRGSVIGPANAFVRGMLGVEADLTLDGGPRRQVLENYFGVEPRSLQRTPLRNSMVLSTNSFLQGNHFAIGPQFQTTEVGGLIQNSVFVYFDSSGARHNVDLVVGTPGWRVVGNVLGHTVNVRPQGTGPGSQFVDNWFASELTSDGPVAQILDAGMGLLSGQCPASGLVEVYRRHEVSDADAIENLRAVQWAPVRPSGAGVAACQADAGWVVSVTFQPGDNVATLFTEDATGHTGPFSSLVVVPSSL